MLAFLAARATPGVELVADGAYARTVVLDAARGFVRVTRVPGRNALRAQVSVALAGVLMPLVARLRRTFDLDAQPGLIGAHLTKDVALRAQRARACRAALAGRVRRASRPRCAPCSASRSAWPPQRRFAGRRRAGVRRADRDAASAAVPAARRSRPQVAARGRACDRRTRLMPARARTLPRWRTPCRTERLSLDARRDLGTTLRALGRDAGHRAMDRAVRRDARAR